MHFIMSSPDLHTLLIFPVDSWCGKDLKDEGGGPRAGVSPSFNYARTSSRCTKSVFFAGLSL